jgi:N-acetylglutamate synthase-like GNAT family acetyltransferase
VEQGFREVPMTELPEARKQMYNLKRRSKVLVKAL